MLPDNADSTLSAADLLALADEEIQSTIGPLIQATREDYYVAYQDVSLVANQREYRIPFRANGGKLRDVTYFSTSTINYGITLERLSLGEADEYAPTGWAGMTPTYCIQGDNIVIVPTPTAALGFLRIRYYRRPSRLVPLSEVAVSTSDNAITGGRRFICSNVPSSWGVLRYAYDFTRTAPNFDTPIVDKQGEIHASGTNGSLDFTMTDAEFASVVEYTSYATDVYYWPIISLPGETAIPHIPAEAHPALAQAVAVKALEALGDRDGMAAAQTKLGMMLDQLQVTLSPRVDGAPQKVAARHGILGATRRPWFPR